MAQVEETRSRSGSSKTRATHRSLRVDLTPMVDLGFLLITFFILTTGMKEPKVADLFLPKDIGETPVWKSGVLNIVLLGQDSISYYHGDNKSEMFYTTYAGIRKVIQNKQKLVASILKTREKMILLINPTDNSRYQNLIDILDEVQINGVQHYYISNSRP